MKLRNVIFLIAFVSACRTAPTPAPTATQTSSASHDLLNSVAWMQTAAEYHASSVQAFAVARVMLDRALADPNWTASLEQRGDFRSKPPAVIVDIDETMLDNSPYQVRMIRLNRFFDDATWKEWVAEANARAIPGALEFARYAAERGVTIFYLSGRTADEEPGTLENLRKLGFPLDASIDVVMTRGEKPEWKTDKTTRRAEVTSRYRVLLLLGDDFRDFTSEGFGTLEERRAAVERHRSRWGREWIVIPNPMYGSWERALIGTSDPLSDDEKRRRKLEKLDAKN